ncbi:hypothetical protein GOV11_00815 [Candidatus Woesearchaeota archaeon]|nr:hypothetical protein [Candidatus Woesearchaeota archaeon]
MTDDNKEKLIMAARGEMKVIRCTACNDICYASECVRISERDDEDIFCSESCALDYLTTEEYAHELVDVYGVLAKKGDAKDYGYGDEDGN